MKYLFLLLVLNFTSAFAQEEKSICERSMDVSMMNIDSLNLYYGIETAKSLYMCLMEMKSVEIDCEADEREFWSSVEAFYVDESVHPEVKDRLRVRVEFLLEDIRADLGYCRDERKVEGKIASPGLAAKFFSLFK